MKHQYDNQFAPTNVYGHAVELIRRNKPSYSEPRAEAIHLDLGCGFGSIAEVVRTEFGWHYVGVDGDEVGLGSLKERGFETHRLEFGTYEATLASLQRIIGDRAVNCITLLDTLEHIYPSENLLKAICAVSKQHSALVVISVPNFTHFDVAIELITGHFDYYPAGIRDHTHLRNFSDAGFVGTLEAAGLGVLDRFDVRRAHEHIFSPRRNPAANPASKIYRYLRSLRDQVDEHGGTIQFVAACIGGPERLAPAADAAEPGPFLSVVTRTQGRRSAALAEVFLCLSAQTDDDFEHIVVAHKVSIEEQIDIERAILELPKWQQDKTRLIVIDEGGRTLPLNAGFQDARGEYIAILDDDDIVFAHWVETFHSLSRRNYGRVLRAAGVRQSTDETRWGEVAATAASGPIEKLYPLEWDELGQLGNNMTPNHGLAFPSGAFKVLNFRFSETLTTIEDWDLIVRIVNVLGVASSPEITSIYRWWDSAESSRTLHSDREWARNRQEIINRLNSQPILLEAGSADLISDLRQDLADQVENQRHLRDHISLALKELETLSARALVAEQALAAGGQLTVAGDAETESSLALARLIEILESTSWRLTGPWRSLRRLLTGRRPISAKDYVGRDAAVIDQAINDILASRAWRATSVVRKLRGG